MFSVLIRRLLLGVPTLVGVSLTVFLAVQAIPGDPARARLGSRASPEALKMERARLGLDKPLAVRYFSFVGRILQGDFGRSIITQEPIEAEWSRRMPATFELSLGAMLLAIGLGIPLGVVAATRRGSWLDAGVLGFSLAGVSIPIFWLALMLLVVVGHFAPGWPVGFRLDPSIMVRERTHFMVLDALLAGNGQAALSAVKHLVLPALALGTIPLALVARMTRAAVLETLHTDFVRTAKAKGLGWAAILFRHALRPALIPIVTVVGLQFGVLLGGAIITETIFAWPGLGAWLLDAINNRDLPVIQACALTMAGVFVLANLAVDLSYVVLDPRIRLKS